jgi:ABC-type multidrug transport system fused ATPase/permease subunit
MSADLMTLVTVILFNTYSQQLFRGLGNISNIWRNIKTGLASAARLNEILELENNIVSPENPYIQLVLKEKYNLKM